MDKSPPKSTAEIHDSLARIREGNEYPRGQFQFTMGVLLFGVCLSAIAFGFARLVGTMMEVASPS